MASCLLAWLVGCLGAGHWWLGAGLAGGLGLEINGWIWLAACLLAWLAGWELEIGGWGLDWLVASIGNWQLAAWLPGW